VFPALLLSVALVTAAWAGKAAEGKGFTVDVQAPASVAPGKAADIDIVLRPTDGYHVNVDFPIKLELVGDGLAIVNAKQGKDQAKQLDEQAARFRAQVSASSTGAKKLTGTLRFAVCSADTCEPKSASFAVAVEVK
jgi:hypothetical protein